MPQKCFKERAGTDASCTALKQHIFHPFKGWFDMKFRGRKPQWQKEIAKERISILFREAKNPERAKRYVRLARKIAMHYRVRIPRELKRKYCKNCNSLLVPGQNCRIRLSQRGTPRIILTCMECSHIMRFPYLKEKMQRKTK